MTQNSELTSSSRAETAHSIAAGNLPKTIGKWELVSLLGEGAFARVFRGRPAGSRSCQAAHYAVKVMRDRWQNDATAIECWHREATVGRAVVHRNLVSVLDAQLAEPPRLIVMPYVPGGSLAARLTRSKWLGLPMAIWITRQVAEALCALHAAGWAHLDIKPSNVLISASGHVTLLDLSMARPLESVACVIDRPVLGTLKYVAPELLTSQIPADGRSDIYSLGVMLFELLTGRLPFNGETAGDLVVNHRQGVPKNIQAMVPSLPAGLVRLVRHMLAKDPLRRPQTAAGLVERLVSIEIETLAERIPA